MRIALRRQDEQIRRYVANFFFYSTTTTEQMPFISDDLVTTATQSTTLRPATQSTTLRPATSTTLRPVTSSTLRPATNTDGTTTEKKTTDNDQVTAGPQSTTLKPATNTDGLTTEKKTTNNEPTESLDVLNSTILSEQGLNGEDKNGCQVFVPAGVILNVLLSLAIHF
ncbi:hypothetical protein EB796_004823 [Bugula neritina]|uniref:Uncharacterized protein n=1 Tax=Bugula neritina TaxID=10212 RepID=A0A7J7KEY0_BUGNE|nr:hypothetical protein EB796_004823 [Bugula neritina]